MKIRSNNIKRVFYIVLILSLLMLVISIPITHFSSLQLYLWKKGSSFYDFFTCLKGNVYWNRFELYKDGTIYPPLANLFYAIITRCMSIDTLQQLNKLTDYNKIKALQECSVFFVMYINITVIAYCILCVKWKKGSTKEKWGFALLMLCTVPFLYQFERANIIFISLILTIAFFIWKDKKGWKREFAYICLAIAAGIKIYPAIFGLVLIKEKKFKDAVKLCLYGAAMFFLPFIFYGGIKQNVMLLINNLMNTSDLFLTSRIGCQIGYETTLKYIFSFTDGNCEYIVSSIKTIILAFSLFSLIWIEKSWKQILLLTCLIIGIPSISYSYAAIFMLIPIVVYLDSGDKTFKELFYLIGMMLVMIPLPFCWNEGKGDPYYSYMNMSIPVRVESIAILALNIGLIISAIKNLMETRIKRKKYIGLCVGVLILTIGLAINTNKINSIFSHTNYMTKTLTDKIVLNDGDKVLQTFTARASRLVSVVLKAKNGQSGTAELSIIKMDTNEVIQKREFDLQNVSQGYIEINVENCYIKPNCQYGIEIKITKDKDDDIVFSKTIPTLDTGNEYLAINNKRAEGALSIQINEKN